MSVHPIDLRGLCAVVALTFLACGGTQEDPVPVADASGSIDADSGAVTFPDGSTVDAEADLGATPSDVPGDAVDAGDTAETEVDAGPPPECTEETSWKCEDGNSCTEDSCTDGACVHAAIAGCCKEDGECDDGVPCTIDQCNPTKSECMYSLGSNVCCVTAADCAEADACDATLCAGHQCQYPVQSETADCACTKNLDCADSSACTNDVCVDGACVYSLSGAESCCLGDDDCEDGDATTFDQCQAGVCWNGPLACESATDCVGPNACSIGQCVEGVCAYESSCCLLDSECDDGHAATQDRCIEGSCVHQLGEEVGCLQDADCASDNPCIVGTCVVGAGACSYAPVAGDGCCETQGDCAQESACANPVCEAFMCGVAPGPGAVAHWTANWDDGTLGGWTVEGDGKAAKWQLTDVQAVSAPHSIYYGQVPAMDYDVGHTQGTITSPGIVVPEDLTGVYLTFWRSVDTEPFVTSDLFSLEIKQGEWQEIWNKNNDGGPGLGWKFEEVPLVITANATIQLRFVFDSVDEKQNATMGVLVDDVKLMMPCP